VTNREFSFPGQVYEPDLPSRGVSNAMRHFDAGLRIRRLEEALREIKAHMGACIIQRAPSDDAVIFDHITAAERLASDILKSE
jgi:hypothetical protein